MFGKCEFKDELDILIHTYMEIRREELAKIGLYKGQPVFLKIINENPGSTQRYIANKVGIKPSTLNVMINRLSKNGLVEKKQDPNDSKSSNIYITQKGKEMVAKAEAIFLKTKKIQYEGFSPKEQEEFKTYVRRITKNLGGAK